MTTIDSEYANLFAGNEQIDLSHFYAVNWTEDGERPILFAFGYWSQGVFHQGIVGYSAANGFGVRRGAMQDHRCTSVV